jgi:phosphoglycolate phosphatase-like HAD superfamily hydrolase
VTSKHIVWDWNGTLLDDLPVVVEAVNLSMGQLGMPPIDENGYRDHFTRPVRAFYDSLFGRPTTDDEWDRLNEGFHDEYFARVDDAALTVDTSAALDAAATLGWGQSLLSMSPQEWLERVVASKGLIDRFALVSGLSGPTGGLKAQHMESHIEALDIHPERVVVVGDTPDDAVAARHVGAAVVLYDGGSHHLPHLEGMDAPVAHSLLQAVEIASRM